MGTTDHARAVAALGHRIHDLRSARGFTLLEFATLAGLTAPALSALERGEESAPVSALFAVAEALELTVSALLSDAAAAEPEPPAEPPLPSVAPPPAAPETAAVAPRRAPAPRTFADLRVGVLADRSFATLPEFAVAAVVEGGQPVSVVAKIFRVPSWRLETWVRDGVEVPRAPTPLRRSR